VKLEQLAYLMAAFIPMKIMASHPFKFMLKEEWLGILKKKEKNIQIHAERRMVRNT